MWICIYRVLPITLRCSFQGESNMDEYGMVINCEFGLQPARHVNRQEL